MTVSITLTTRRTTLGTNLSFEFYLSFLLKKPKTAGKAEKLSASAAEMPLSDSFSQHDLSRFRFFRFVREAILFNKNSRDT